VDLVAAVVADEQPFELMQPGEGALDHPAVAAEPGAVPALAAGDLRFDPSLSHLTPVLVVVVAAIGAEPVGTTARTADASGDSRNRVEERDQLGDIVAVAARDRPGERDPCPVDQEVVL